MAEGSKPPPRQHIHRRIIEVDAFLRDDGLWDLEGSLCDVRDDDFAFVWGTRVAGDPIHHMRLDMTVDAHFLIREAGVRFLGVPYAGVCERIAGRYARLSGLRIGRGFRKEVSALFSDVSGCTHVSHLVLAMASAAYQSIARPPGLAARISEYAIGGCHTLARDGEVVQTYLQINRSDSFQRK
jgi:hypothetical protein